MTSVTILASVEMYPKRISLMLTKYAIAQHDLKPDISTYEMLQKLSVTLTEKTPLGELFAKPKICDVKDQFDPNGQLLLNF